MRFDSLEDMPPALRKRVEEQLAKERTEAQNRQRHASGKAPKEKSSKYHNQKAEALGRTFDSRHEAERYMQLRSMEQNGIISELRCQVPYELIPTQTIDGVTLRAARYIADFVYKRGNVEVVEDAKGVKTAVYQLKKKLMAVNYGILVQEV